MSVQTGLKSARPMTLRSSIVRGVGIGVVLAIVFLGGFFFREALPSLAAPHNDSGRNPASQAGNFPLLAQAQSLLMEHYLRELPDPVAQEYGAIRGLIGTLNDRLTYFIDPPVAASESNVLAGQYGGIGVLVRRDEAGRFVLSPFRDGPAARAGVRDGDILLKVNDAPIAPETGIDAVDQLLRGEVKETNGVKNGVKIEVQDSKGAEAARTFTIPFETIEIPSVIWRRLEEAPEFGYIQILRFTARTPTELQNAFAELQDAGRNNTPLRALVLDVRNNPGGLLAECIEVASRFLPENTLVLKEKSKKGEKEYRSTPGKSLTDLPMMVIVNRGTASAAEIVAGALKDNQRARIIGQTSYGKGTVQLIFQLADKSSLHVTTAEFFPPSGVPMEGVGIVPDIPMIPDQNGRDVELGEAIRQLRDKLAQG
jgi:carboxyl-terminal processing protease